MLVFAWFWNLNSRLCLVRIENSSLACSPVWCWLESRFGHEPCCVYSDALCTVFFYWNMCAASMYWGLLANFWRFKSSGKLFAWWMFADMQTCMCPWCLSGVLCFDLAVACLWNRLHGMWSIFCYFCYILLLYWFCRCFPTFSLTQTQCSETTL